MINDQELKEWVDRGRKDNYNYLLIIHDLDVNDYFPVYFHFYSDILRYRENIISESKIKVRAEFKLNNKIIGVD